MSEFVPVPPELEPPAPAPAPTIPGMTPAPPVIIGQPVEPSPLAEPPTEVPTIPGLEGEPGIAGGVPGLSDLARLLVIIGLILLAAVIVDAINKLLRWMLGPLWKRAGSRQASPEQFTQWISNSLGSAFQGIDAELGVAFQQLADTTGRLGSAIVNAEQTAYKIATRVAEHSTSLKRSQAAETTTSGRVDVVAAAAAAALTAAQDASQDAKRAEQTIEAKVDVITTHITTVIEPELEALRHRVPELERGATVAWDTLKQHGEALGAAGVTAAVAAALSRLGGGWIRCETNQLLGRALCQSDSNLIRKLLGDALDVLAVADLCELSTLVVAAGEEMAPVLEAFVGVESALIGCHGYDRPHAIKLATVSATPVLQPVAL